MWLSKGNLRNPCDDGKAQYPHSYQCQYPGYNIVTVVFPDVITGETG